MWSGHGLSKKRETGNSVNCLTYWHLNSNTMLWYYETEPCAGLFDPSRNMGPVEHQILYFDVLSVEQDRERGAGETLRGAARAPARSRCFCPPGSGNVAVRETDLQSVIRPR